MLKFCMFPPETVKTLRSVCMHHLCGVRNHIWSLLKLGLFSTAGLSIKISVWGGQRSDVGDWSVIRNKSGR